MCTLIVDNTGDSGMRGNHSGVDWTQGTGPACRTDSNLCCHMSRSRLLFMVSQPANQPTSQPANQLTQPTQPARMHAVKKHVFFYAPGPWGAKLHVFYMLRSPGVPNCMCFICSGAMGCQIACIVMCSGALGCLESGPGRGVPWNNAYILRFKGARPCVKMRTF